MKEEFCLFKNVQLEINYLALSAGVRDKKEHQDSNKEWEIGLGKKRNVYGCQTWAEKSLFLLKELVLL